MTTVNINFPRTYYDLKEIKSLIIFTIFIIIFHHSNAQSKIGSAGHFSSDSLINYCLSLKGIAYKWAGMDTAGFDCSGFVSFVFKHFKIDVGHSSGYLATLGKKVSLSEALPGDVLIFSGTDSTQRVPGHAGIIISEKGEPLQFMHSSSSKNHPGVIITSFYNGYYPSRFLDVRRIASFE